MSISLTQLRANLYKLVDQVIESGIPIEIERKGVTVQLVSVRKKSKLANLTKHPGTIKGSPEDIVHVDWSKEWKGRKAL